MTHFLFLTMLPLALFGCARKADGDVRPQSAADCRQQFTSPDVSKFLDRVTTRAAKDHWPAVTVSFEVVAAQRSPDKLESLIAKLAGDQDVSVETRGDLTVIAVDRSKILEQGAASLARDLSEVCSVVAANDARLTHWRYRLVDVSLDDGLMHSPPVP